VLKAISIEWNVFRYPATPLMYPHFEFKLEGQVL
jgi:hypothetical protein